MTVIKRKKNDSAKDLVTALAELVALLDVSEDQEAIDFLKSTASELKTTSNDIEKSGVLARKIQKAFGPDEFELSSYILERVNPEKWGHSEQLSSAASRVLSLSKRLSA